MVFHMLKGAPNKDTDIQEKEQKESQKQQIQARNGKDKVKVSSMAEIDSKEAQLLSMAGIRALKSLTEETQERRAEDLALSINRRLCEPNYVWRGETCMVPAGSIVPAASSSIRVPAGSIVPAASSSTVLPAGRFVPAECPIIPCPIQTKKSSICMRTRSQARRLRQHQRQQQQVPPNLVEPPKDTMADNRTMAELLQAPTEGYEDAIVVPEIEAANFEIKHGLLTLVQNKQFFGHDKDV
ncbi:hypothetical protein Tco_1237406, partial [Tanacetum coccineum]